MKIQSIQTSALAVLATLSCFSVSILAQAESPSQPTVSVTCNYSFS